MRRDKRFTKGNYGQLVQQSEGNLNIYIYIINGSLSLRSSFLHQNCSSNMFQRDDGEPHRNCTIWLWPPRTARKSGVMPTWCNWTLEITGTRRSDTPQVPKHAGRVQHPTQRGTSPIQIIHDNTVYQNHSESNMFIVTMVHLSYFSPFMCVKTY